MGQFIHKWRKILPYLFLAFLTFFFCWLFCIRQGVFGAKMDWLSQHSAFLEYFRKQFYDTGQLFPEFAANIGGGQNIYHFSYYGLYSPVVFFSYLLPFVKMSDYLMAVQIISLTAAVLMMYGWLIQQGFAKEVSAGCAVMFLLAGPMIFQSYSQIMFVNYMPYLLLALMGITQKRKPENPDSFFQIHGKMVAIGTFLMIMTSFYFSIGGILVLILYGVHQYFQICDESRKKVTVVRFLQDGIRFLMPILTAILMSGILLVPTAMVLLGQGRGGGVSQSLKELLLPEFSLERFFYSPYGTGLTTLAFAALLTGMTYKKRADRIFYGSTLVILLVPVFAWLLNGGLYIRDKVFIPFLPLLCYMTAVYLKKQKQKEISWAAGVIPYLLTALFIVMEIRKGQMIPEWNMLLVDVLMMLCCFMIFLKMRKVAFLITPALFCLTVFGVVYHTQADRMLEKTFYEKVTEETTGTIISQLEKEETGFYRTEQLGTGRENEANQNRIWDMEQYSSSVYSSFCHAGYQDFCRHVFHLEVPLRNILMRPVSKNPVFQCFMGVKYIISEKPVAGYECDRNYGNISVYRNDNVLPMIYATNRLIEEKTYQELGFPYNQMAFLDYAVTEEGERNGGGTAKEKESVLAEMESSVKKQELSIEKQKDAGEEILKTADGFHIRAKHTIDTPALVSGQAKEGDILFLRFRVKNNRNGQDVSVDVNGVRNKLSAADHIYYNDNRQFTYAVLPEEGKNVLELSFGKGDYEISELECFLGTADSAGEKLCQSEFQPDPERTKGNRIAGNIEVYEEGYVITSIPYDAGFEVRRDGEEIAYRKVNMAFLGFPIEKGEHTIEIVYHAPGLTAGKILSVIGMSLFLCFCKKKHSS
ncbi:MAG: YfhO family protein [Lachnospiraceae bacterium]|jgi:uncharacterized membrane protein YfhO